MCTVWMKEKGKRLTKVEKDSRTGRKHGGLWEDYEQVLLCQGRGKKVESSEDMKSNGW